MTLLFDTSHVYDMIRSLLVMCASMIILWICV